VKPAAGRRLSPVQRWYTKSLPQHAIRVSGEGQSSLSQLTSKKRSSVFVEMNLLPETKNDLLTTNSDPATCIAIEALEINLLVDAINTGYLRVGCNLLAGLNRHDDSIAYLVSLAFRLLHSR